MIKKYRIRFSNGDAEARFDVDTDIFTKELANDTLQFFDWEYDTDADPIDEVITKYGKHAIWLATTENVNTVGVIYAFEDSEGYCQVDGKYGITLTYVEGVDLNYDDDYSLTIL